MWDQGKTTRDRLIIVKQMFKWAATKAKPKMLRENPIENEDVPDNHCFAGGQFLLNLSYRYLGGVSTKIVRIFVSGPGGRHARTSCAETGPTSFP